jgi:hypothetical protein
MRKNFRKILFALVVAALGAIYVGAAFASIAPGNS